MKPYLFGVLSVLLCYGCFMTGIMVGEDRVVGRVNKVLRYQMHCDDDDAFDAVYYELNGMP